VERLGRNKSGAIRLASRHGPFCTVFPERMSESKVLTGMEGKLWIDKKTLQWVKVEATVIHPVSIGGFLAEVLSQRTQVAHPAEVFHSDQTDVAWLLEIGSKACIKTRSLFQ
jgi:hypothetical protein